MLANDFPMLGIFWTLMFVAFWAAILGAIFYAFADILRNRDLGGAGKAFWVLLVVWVPVLGILAWILYRERLSSEADFAKAREETRQRKAAGTS